VCVCVLQRVKNRISRDHVSWASRHVRKSCQTASTQSINTILYILLFHFPICKESYRDGSRV